MFNFHLETKLGKSANFILRILITVVLSILAATSFIIFVFGVVQGNYPNAGDAFPSSSSEHFCCNRMDTVCDSGGVLLPTRYLIIADQNQTQRYAYCSWGGQLNAWRCVATFLLMIMSVGLIGVLSKRSPASTSAAVWENPKRVLKFSLIPAFLGAFAAMVFMIADGSSVNASRSWCTQFASDQASIGSPIQCDYTTFIVVVVLDTICFIFWGLLFLLIFLRKSKYFLKYQQLDEFEDEDDEFDLDDGSSTSATRSKLRDKVDRARDKQKKGSRISRL